MDARGNAALNNMRRIRAQLTPEHWLFNAARRCSDLESCANTSKIPDCGRQRGRYLRSSSYEHDTHRVQPPGRSASRGRKYRAKGSNRDCKAPKQKYIGVPSWCRQMYRAPNVSDASAARAAAACSQARKIVAAMLIMISKVLLLPSRETSPT